MSIIFEFLESSNPVISLPEYADGIKRESSYLQHLLRSFLSFDIIDLTFTDWSTMIRALLALEVACQNFLKKS